MPAWLAAICPAERARVRAHGDVSSTARADLKLHPATLHDQIAGGEARGGLRVYGQAVRVVRDLGLSERRRIDAEVRGELEDVNQARACARLAFFVEHGLVARERVRHLQALRWAVHEAITCARRGSVASPCSTTVGRVRWSRASVVPLVRPLLHRQVTPRRETTMRRLLFVLGALWFAPAPALAGPVHLDSINIGTPDRQDPRPDWSCNAGQDGALLIGLAGLALVRRRRAR